MRMLLAKLRRFSGPLALLALAGCASVPPGRITIDRMDYGQVIAETGQGAAAPVVTVPSR